MAERQLRIALLIDADNAPADKIDEILTELSTLGEINVRRAYGNWTKSGLGGWQQRLLEFAIRPIQQFDYSKRKNATDMAMTVDAMELLYSERPDAFGIVSSDADFTPLVMHLRAKGSAVYGFGAAQTPKPFVNACSRFLYLESLVSEEDAEGAPLPAQPEATAAPAQPAPAKTEDVPAPGV
ncbi:NYN domain-containing protein, partial [Diaphorobacter nitroreducens]